MLGRVALRRELPLDGIGSDTGNAERLGYCTAGTFKEWGDLVFRGRR